MRMFETRAEAGKLLAAHLLARHLQAEVVLGLPRGGVIVAAEVASALGLPLDALVVRKIGHPHHRELAVGAIAEDGTVKRDDGLGHAQQLCINSAFNDVHPPSRPWL